MAEQRVYNGYVYTRNSPSDPWTIAGPASPTGGRQATVVSNPFRVRDEARKDQSQEIDRARLGISQAGEARDAQRDNAELPYVGTKAAADAAKAQADAERARIEAAQAASEQAKVLSPQARQAQQSLKTSALLEALNTARAQIGNGWATGNFAGRPSFQGVPLIGQNSADLNATLSGIQGSIINDTLTQLKAQSATGASGYGSLTETEAQRLAAAVGALQQTQSEESLLANLARVERHYRNALAFSNGEDPRDNAVAAKYGIVAAPDSSDPTVAAALGQNGSGGGQPPAAGGTNGPNSGGPGGLTNQGKFVDDPGLRGANATVRQMIQQGASPFEVRAYLDRLRPGYGAQVNGIEEAVNDWRQNPQSRRQVNIDLEKVWQPASGVAQTLGSIGMTPVGTALIGAGDIASLGLLDNLTENPEATRAVQAGLEQENPGSYLAGQVLGGVTGGLGLQGLLGRAGVGTARAALAADTILGAGYGAGSADQPGDSRVLGALLGGAAGAAGNVVGTRAANVVGRGLAGVSDAAQNTLNDLGVRLTPGQILGGSIKRNEDRLAGLPFVGDAIQARRREGVQDFNRAAIDEALAPIGATTGGRIAEPGQQAAQDAVSQAYRAALAGQSFQTDPAYVAATNQLAGRVQAIPRVGDDLYAGMTTAIAPMIENGGRFSGEAMQDILQGTRAVGDAYRGGGFSAADPLYASHIAPAISDYTAILEDLVERQAPGTISALRSANAANRGVSTVGDAVIAAANRGGEFMPSQLMNASKANSKAFSGKRATAAGQGPLFDLARAGQEVLPSQIPDSGTAGRLVLPLLAGSALGGGTYAAQDGTAAEAAPSSLATGAVAAALLGAPYSRSASSIIQRALLSERPQAVESIGELLLRDRSRNISGLLGGAGATIYAGN